MSADQADAPDSRENVSEQGHQVTANERGQSSSQKQDVWEESQAEQTEIDNCVVFSASPVFMTQFVTLKSRWDVET